MVSIQKIGEIQFDKITRQAMARQVIADLSEGTANPVQIHYNIKCLEDLIKQITNDKEYKSIVLFEAEKHGKSFEFKNSKVEIKETAVKYDYSVCNDPEWNKLEAEILALKDKQKERETFLKTIRPHGIEIVDENGEVYTLFPPVKTSTTSVAVTLK